MNGAGLRWRTASYTAHSANVSFELPIRRSPVSSMTTNNTTWTINDSQVLVDGQPFFARGVSYSPVPWGSCTAFDPFGDFTIDTWSSVWQRDLALMRSNGVNVLKTYNTLDAAQLQAAGLPTTWDHDHSELLAACWNGGSQPIYVLMGYAPPKNQQSIFLTSTWSDPSNEQARAQIQADLVALAQTYADAPALMGFVMANEINADNIIDNALFFEYWNGVAQAIAQVAPGKLTALANVDDSMNTVRAGASSMTAANFFWGYNSYRGNWTNSNGFDTLFSDFASATQSNPKPLMLTEWGAPASTHDAQGNMEDLSATQMDNLNTYVTGHYQNMLANRSDTGAGVCCGGTYFEWTDEYWKADPPNMQCNQPGAAPSCHTQIWDPGPNMSPQSNFPGGYWDEEGFGLYAIAPVDPGVRVPVTPGGCVGPWNPDTNAPYPPDQLTMRAHAQALFQLFSS